MSRISHKQMSKLFQRLATSYSAGLDIRRIYEREAKNGSGVYRKNSELILKKISNGSSLAEALEATDGYFPDLAVSIVRAGEKGGRLDESFKRLAKHYRNLVEFRDRFLLSIAWPMFELVAAILIVGLMMWLMGWLCDQAPDEPFMDWFGMGSTRANLTLYCVMVSVVAVSAFLFILGIAKGWFGELPMKILRRIPLLGKTVEALSLSRFAWTLSVAENAGMDAVEAAELSLRASENYYYTRLESEVCESIQSGNSFYQSFDDTEAFPDDLLTYIQTGEEAGELAESMNRASDELQVRVENNFKIIGKIGFMLTFIFVAMIIGFTIISLYQKYMNTLSDFL